MTTATSPSEAFLQSLPSFAHVGRSAYMPGLDRIRAILNRMGEPQRAYPSLHVAGTNGKGSTASFLAAIATASGLKTGLHTSPHLLHVGERMRIDGVPAPPTWLDGAVDRYAGAFMDAGASFFEVTTALSFLYFTENAVEMAVAEVGLGGRFDATNVLLPEVALITDVSMDHEDILGNTIESIAAEKAGIVKPGTPILTAARRNTVLDVIREAAEAAGAPLHVLDREVRITTVEPGFSIATPVRVLSDVRMDLPGTHQIRNAALAIRAAELSPTLANVSEADVRTGIERVRKLSGLRGRIERIYDCPWIYADVAHNAEALTVSAETCLEMHGRLDGVLLGVMKDKRIEQFGAWLASHGVRATALGVRSERALDAARLTSLLQESGAAVGEPYSSTEQALDALIGFAAPDSTYLVAGSHLVVADALRWATATDSSNILTRP